MMTVGVALVLGGVLALPQPTAWAAHRKAFQAQTTADGIKVTLSIPRQTWLRNELVELSVRVQNVSAGPVDLSAFPTFCGSDNPAIIVRNTSGKVLYPPAVLPPSDLAPPCPHPATFPLAPKQSVTRAVHAVLRGANVSARVLVQSVSENGDMAIETTPIHLRLHSVGTPKVTLRTTPGKVSAMISKPRGARGPLLYQYWEKCADPQNFGDIAPDWVNATGNRVSAGDCTGGLQWHVTAGWVGFPAVTINYPASASR
jgi:hypothetical protein